jgi:putative addiction module component (TIGR02574 family)
MPAWEDGLPMDATTEQLLQSALALPEEERLELVEALLASEDQTNGLPFDPALLSEIRRRSGEIEAGTAHPNPWPVVRERVRQRLESRSRG